MHNTVLIFVVRIYSSNTSSTDKVMYSLFLKCGGMCEPPPYIPVVGLILGFGTVFISSITVVTSNFARLSICRAGQVPAI